MARQTPGNRVDTKAYLDTARAQFLGNFRHRILRLRHRHTVPWGDDHRVGIFQHFGGFFGVNLAVFAHFFFATGRGTVGTKTTGNHANERTVHRLTHDVRQNGTGRTYQRTGNDQQVVAEHKARRRRRPTGVGVQHGDDYRHICPADRRHQMPAKGQRDNGHHQQTQHLRAHAIGTHECHHQQERNHQRRQVKLVTIWQHQRLRRHLAAQLAERHDGTGKGDRTDKDTEEHFSQVNIDQNLFHAGFMLQVAVEAHQHRGQTDEAVQHRHQLRHLGHFQFLRQANTNRPTDNHRQQDPRYVAGIRPEDGCDQGNRHTGDAVVVALLRRFVFGKPGETENKQDCGNNVCSCN